MKARAVGFAGALTAGLLMFGAGQAQTVIRISHGMPEAMESDQHAWAVVFKEEVESGSGGKLEVRILGNNADNKGNTEAQTKEAMSRIERTMKAAGVGFADLADAVVYITDVANFQAMNNCYRPAIGKDFPARATVKTGLVGSEGLVEIMFVAAK